MDDYLDDDLPQPHAPGRPRIRVEDANFDVWLKSDEKLTQLKREVLEGCERFWRKRGMREPSEEWSRVLVTKREEEVNV